MTLEQKYLPTPEHQRKAYTVEDRRFIFDTLGCVSEATTNCVEFLVNKKKDQEDILEHDIQFLKKENYFDKKDKFNASGRELAKRSETTKSGNSAHKVAQTAANGLVAEKLWPWPEPGEDGKVVWDEYYSPLTEKVEEQRKEFDKRFEIPFKWVHQDNFVKKLEEGTPLLFLVHAWKKNKNKYENLYYKTSSDDYNHGVFGFGYEPQNKDEIAYWNIFDTYDPFVKKVHPNNVYEWAMEFDFIPKNNPMSIEKFKKDNVNNIVRNKETGAYGVIYQDIDTGEITVYHVPPRRAGIFMLDREARGIIGNYEKVEVKDSFWKSLKPKKF